MDPRLEKLQQILALLQDDTLKPSDVERFISIVLDVIVKTKDSFEQLSSKNLSTIESGIEKIKSLGESSLSQLDTSITQKIQEATLLLEEIREIKATPGKDSTVPGPPGPAGELGPPGKDGSPDTSEQVRDKLELLKGEERLDASAIKNLPELVGKTAEKLPVGGIRFLDQLADVGIALTDKRKNVIIQYNSTLNRWQVGPALTVSATQPTSPQVNDLWIDLT